MVQWLVRAAKEEDDTLRLRSLADPFVEVMKHATPEQVEVLARAVNEETDPNRLIMLAAVFVEGAVNATPVQAGMGSLERWPGAVSGGDRQIAGSANWPRCSWWSRRTPHPRRSSPAVAQRLARAMKAEYNEQMLGSLAGVFAEVVKNAKFKPVELVSRQVSEDTDTVPSRLGELAEEFAAMAKDAMAAAGRAGGPAPRTGREGRDRTGRAGDRHSSARQPRGPRWPAC